VSNFERTASHFADVWQIARAVVKQAVWLGRTDRRKMRCREAEDLLEAYGAFAEAYGLAVNAVVKVLSGSRAEFWSALKIAEAAKDDCDEALKAIDLHVMKHQCQPNLWI
jgi:hypothetical protein